MLKCVDSRLTSCYDLSVYIVNSVHIFISLYLYVLWFKRNKESESEFATASILYEIDVVLKFFDSGMKIQDFN
jgi:hypothetical protein